MTYPTQAELNAMSDFFDGLAKSDGFEFNFNPHLTDGDVKDKESTNSAAEITIPWPDGSMTEIDRAQVKYGDTTTTVTDATYTDAFDGTTYHSNTVDHRNADGSRSGTTTKTVKDADGKVTGTETRTWNFDKDGKGLMKVTTKDDAGNETVKYYNANGEEVDANGKPIEQTEDKLWMPWGDVMGDNILDSMDGAPEEMFDSASEIEALVDHFVFDMM